MTLEEMTLLADIMRGRELTQKSLARILVQTYQDLERVKAELKAARVAVRRRTPRQADKRIKTLEQKLASKQKALDFAIKRQEVLRGQLAQALGPKASRPAHLLNGRSDA